MYRKEFEKSTKKLSIFTQKIVQKLSYCTYGFDLRSRKKLYHGSGSRDQLSSGPRIQIRNTVWKAALHPIFNVSIIFFLSFLDEEVV
jgi:hypothetical protein